MQHGLAGDLFGGDVGGAGNLVEDAFDLFGLADQHVEIVAVELDGDVGADAGHHFVHPHLDRLEELQPLAGQVAEVPLDQRRQFGLRVRLFPLARAA